MFAPFRLKKTIDPASNVDLDDVWSLKHAFQGIGYYRPPDFGMHEYPDDGLFDGIKRFQKDQGLTVDGIMKPEGETATRLGEVIGRRRAMPNVRPNHFWSGRSPLEGVPRTTPTRSTLANPLQPFALNSRVDRAANVAPDDTLRTKKALNGLGYYRIPSYGMTPYPDEPLFNGIERFQKDHGLTVDGIMKPAGETATKLGEVLKKRHGSNIGMVADDGGDEPGDHGEGEPCDEGSLLAAVGGGSRVCKPPSESGDDCWGQYEDDTETCRILARDENRARCWASAMDRYSSCIAGRPLPPLDIGD